LQYIFGATEGTFQVDYPLFSERRPQPGGEGLWLSKELEISLETELTVMKSLLESVGELVAKDFPEHGFGKKVASL
jgi:hypothetical protein